MRGIPESAGESVGGEDVPRNTTTASRPRRAAADESPLASAFSGLPHLRPRRAGRPDEGSRGRYAVIEEPEAGGDDRRHLLTSGCAALVVSALGLAVAGATSLTSTSQTANPQARAEATGSAGTPDRAEPADQQGASEIDPNADLDAAANQTDDSQATIVGQLSERAGDASGTSRSAARTELDAAMSVELADERSKQLSAASSEAAEASRTKALENRSRRLNDSQGSISQENERLEEEKKKQEQEAAAKAKGTLSVSTATKATLGNIKAEGGVSTPLKRGSYRTGAGFGQVGSWSRYHTGQDFPAPTGTPVYAAADGVVAPSNGGGWAGTHVVIKHSGGDATLYAHMSAALVSPGQTVKAGQQVGFVGMTGRTFGPHLHFEYYPSASSVGNPYTAADPRAWLASRGVSI